MGKRPTEPYWFEPYLQDFFYCNKYKIYRKFIDQEICEYLINVMCETIIASSRNHKEEEKDIKKKCYNDLLSIIRNLTTFRVIGKDDNTPSITGYESSTDNENFTTERKKYTKHIKLEEGKDSRGRKKYKVTLLLFSFALTEIYYKHFFKKKMYENFYWFERFDVIIVKTSYNLAHHKKITKEDYKYMKENQLNTLEDYYNNLTQIIDLWWALSYRYVLGVYYEDEYKNTEIMKNHEKIQDELKILFKNHYFLNTVYPLYCENKVMEQLNEKKKAYKKELGKICSKNFQCLNNDNLNIQSNSKTRNLILNNCNAMLEKIEDITNIERFTDYEDVLQSILVDYDAYIKQKNENYL